MSLAQSPRTSIPTEPAPVRSARRWPSVIAIVVGTVLVVTAVIWRTAVVPALVKFPTDVDHVLRYEGTFTLFADPETAAPLAEPMTAGLVVDRHVDAIDGSSSEVVVRESITFEVEGLPAATQVHQYVIDRTTHANVDDDRGWAFEESNVLDRSGTHRIALPPELDDDAAVAMYKDEVGTAYTAVAGRATRGVEGLQLTELQAGLDTGQPLTEAYLRSLDAVVPLPRSLTFDQLRPTLLAAGVPVDDAMAAIAAVATPDELSTLAALIESPIPLEYVMTFGGQSFVEPKTGAIVDVASVHERVGARPAGEAMSVLVDILLRHRDDPTIATTVDRLEELAADPPPVFEYRYAETPSSVERFAGWVAEQRDRIELAERTIPSTLALSGSILVGIGALLLVRAVLSRRRGDVDIDDLPIAA